MLGIGDLVVQLGAIGDSKAVKAFGEAVKKVGKAIEDFDKKQEKSEGKSNKLAGSIGKTALKIAGIAGAVATAYYTLDRLTESLAKQNQQWVNLARQSNIALNTLQRWDTIGKIVGIEGVGQQIQDLEQKIFNARLTGEGYEGFAWGGIAPTSSQDVINQLRKRVANMDNVSATNLLQRMGLDPKLITILRLTNSELDEFNKASRYTLTAEQRENIDKMNRELEIARIKFKYLKDSIVVALMPAFVKLTNAIAFVVSKIAKLVDWLAQGQGAGAKITRIILGITTAVYGLRFALMALNAHPIVRTITLILGALMGLWSFIEDLVDDIQHYNNGGGSLIGVIAKGLEDLNLKGFIDFPVPKWLEFMMRFIDFVTGRATDRAVQARLEETVKAMDPNAVKTADGGWASVPPEFVSSVGTHNVRNSTKNVTYNVKNDISTSQPAQDIYKQLLYGNMRGVYESNE